MLVVVVALVMFFIIKPGDDISQLPSLNTASGNVANDSSSSYITADGDWIYFCNYYDGDKTFQIYRINIQTGKGEKWGKDAASSIYAAGGWIYYTNWGDKQYLYKINADGTGRQKLNAMHSSVIKVIGDWIYYQEYEAESRLFYFCKMQTDGTNKQLLATGDEIGDVRFIDEWIYYINKSDDSCIYRIRTDGEGRERIVNDKINNMIILDDWIYCTHTDEAGALYRIRTDGTDQEGINGRSGSFNVINNWIYYANAEDDRHIYKISTDGMDKEQINSDRSHIVLIAEGYLYYYVDLGGKDMEMYRIRLDDNERQRVL